MGLWQTLQQLLFSTSETLEDRYLRTGGDFANAAHDKDRGRRPKDFNDRFAAWRTAEQEYAAAGFRTVSLTDFAENDVHGLRLKGWVGVLRDPDEAAVYYADAYCKSGTIT